MSAVSSLRTLAARANASARFRVRRWLDGPPPAPEPVAPPAVPRPTGEPGDRWFREDVDVAAMAARATTRMERLYWTHRGRRMFKWPHFLPVYDEVLAPFAGRPCTLVEVGVSAGGSLQLWRAFLGAECRLVGVDIDPGAKGLEEPGVEILVGDQGDPAFLSRLAAHVGRADVVIDDGSHVGRHQIATFEALFPLLPEGGVYVCEDLHTAYWPEYEGAPGRADTFVGYIHRLYDRMHAPYYRGELPEGDPARDIGRIILADSMAVIRKGGVRDPHMAVVGGIGLRA